MPTYGEAKQIHKSAQEMQRRAKDKARKKKFLESLKTNSVNEK